MIFARAPRFWSVPRSLAGTLLSPIGNMVGRITLRRMEQPGVIVPVVVICIGNPTVGGSGKTPTVIAVLKRLIEREARPFALLRGHGGEEVGPLVVDPAVHDAGTVGDEALLLAETAPTIVSHDRVAGAKLAVSLGATHVVMDDGFQNPSIVKNASLLVVDGTAGIGNGRIIPAGPLRAPFREQLDFADALLLVGSGDAGEKLPVGKKPVLHGKLVPDADAVQWLDGRRVLAFAGIGQPDKFFSLLEEIGATVTEKYAFADHHPYSVADIQKLVDRAYELDLELVTTDKDKVRLSSAAFADVRDYIRTLPVHMEFDMPVELDILIEKAEVRAVASGTSSDPLAEKAEEQA